MLIFEKLRQVRREQSREDSSSEKIIDFFAAKKALYSKARSASRRAELRARALINSKRQVHLFDPFEDLMFLLLLMAASVLGLLAIAGFG
jgi:hypothetical protein